MPLRPRFQQALAQYLEARHRNTTLQLLQAALQLAVNASGECCKRKVDQNNLAVCQSNKGEAAFGKDDNVVETLIEAVSITTVQEERFGKHHSANFPQMVKKIFRIISTFETGCPWL